jgi:hypothetical protein
MSFTMTNQPFRAVMCQLRLPIGCTLVNTRRLRNSDRRASDGVFARAVARAKGELKRFPTTSRTGDPEIDTGLGDPTPEERAPKRDEREEECTDCLPTNRVIKRAHCC